MPLVPMTSLLAHARAGGYAVGYFEAWDGDSLEAVIAAAEAERAPVILGFGCMMAAADWLDAGGIEALAGLGRPLVERARVPAAFLLNEAHTLQQAQRAIDAGFNAAMVDTSAWDWERAVHEVAELVAYAHERGASVEAELGRLPDTVDGVVDASAAALTDPDQAAMFARRTGIDCLAVSVGNVHLLAEGYAPVDLAHLEVVSARVGLPLVLHGGSSIPPALVARAIDVGVAKVNVGTVLKDAFLAGVRATVAAFPPRVNAHEVLGSHTATDLLAVGKARMRERVRERIRLYGGSGRADA